MAWSSTWPRWRRWASGRLHASLPTNRKRGLLFGRRGQQLVVIAERGGQPAAPPPPVAEDLPASRVMAVHVSPNFGADNTLLVEMEAGRIYRSTDGGASWMRLQGGLPTDDNGTLFVAFSPNYANDRTLYATGHRGDAWGEGVWRSTDGGDTWSALWNNLVHRRGLEFIFDADFPQSRTLVLRAAFNDLANNVSGESYQQSTDGGLSWTVVATGNYSTAAGTVPLPPVGELLPGGAPPALNVAHRRLRPCHRDDVGRQHLADRHDELARRGSLSPIVAVTRLSG